MPPRPTVLLLACLLGTSLLPPPASARPPAGGSATLRVGVRILADCRRPEAAQAADCRPARQRSDNAAPVPAQVAALTPVAEAPRDGRPGAVTETY
ncbi:hypothetical protein [Stenotrophomonas sp.]|uniref:hypothetical protein n=1 Tax=Stenotrophomonas sp. TaxID=69392 RepID=UPI002FCC4460